MPAAFFSVSLSAASARQEDQEGLAQIVAQFLHETGWQPEQIGAFAGALVYQKYGLLKRLLMKMIVKRAGGETDTTHNYTYTDWDAVTQFAEDFLSRCCAGLH